VFRWRRPRSLANGLQHRAPSFACATSCLMRRCSARCRTCAARLDEPRHLRRSTAVRCAALHRRLRSADRRHHRPTGYNRPPDSNQSWIKVRANVTAERVMFAAAQLSNSAILGYPHATTGSAASRFEGSATTTFGCLSVSFWHNSIPAKVLKPVPRWRHVDCGAGGILRGRGYAAIRQRPKSP
jgi:hypothetical protein